MLGESSSDLKVAKQGGGKFYEKHASRFVTNRIVTRISLITWEHIIFTGRHHFKNHREINFEELVDYLAQNSLI